MSTNKTINELILNLRRLNPKMRFKANEPIPYTSLTSINVSPSCDYSDIKLPTKCIWKDKEKGELYFKGFIIPLVTFC